MTSPSGSKIIMEGQFDRRYIGYYRIWVSMFLVITVVGILFIPFWLISACGTARVHTPPLRSAHPNHPRNRERRLLP